MDSEWWGEGGKEETGKGVWHWGDRKRIAVYDSGNTNLMRSSKKTTLEQQPRKTRDTAAATIVFIVSSLPHIQDTGSA